MINWKKVAKAIHKRARLQDQKSQDLLRKTIDVMSGEETLDLHVSSTEAYAQLGGKHVLLLSEMYFSFLKEKGLTSDLNYLEMTVEHPTKGGLIVTFQKAKRPSPHDLRKVAEAKVIQLEKELENCKRYGTLGLNCNFCGKGPDEVKVIQGPAVQICAECVEICNAVLSEEVVGE